MAVSSLEWKGGEAVFFDGITPSADITKGQLVNFGGKIGVCVEGATQNVLSQLSFVFGGEHQLKYTSHGMTAGDTLYYTTADGALAKTAGDGKIVIGVVTKAAGTNYIYAYLF